MLQLTPLPRTLAAALRDVRDRRASVRISALRDLVRHAAGGDRESVLGAFESVLRQDRASSVRAEAAVCIADVEGKEILPALVAALDDADLRVRQMALVAIGEVGAEVSAEAREAVEGCLGAKEPALRFQSLIAWNRIAGASALPDLERALSDEDPEVRHIAVRLAEEHWLDRSSKGLGVAARDVCERLLRDPALSVRVAAAIVLGRGGSMAGADVLVEAVDSIGRGLEPEDEQSAVELAGRLGLSAARPGLGRRAFGLRGLRDPFSWHARIALVRLGDDRAKAAILGALDGWTRDTRTLAVVAAGQSGLTEARDAISAMRGDARRAEPDAVDEALRLLDGARL